MSIRDRRTIAAVGAATLMAAALLAPLVILGRHGLTLTGITEESTGYRYFYTLRMLYGHGERPWLPQGQLPGLSHIAIQVGLTLAGLSPTSLFPRIDLFAYSAAALPHVLALGAFVWMGAVLPPESYLSVAGIAALTFLGGRATLSESSNYPLVQPDYMTWVEPISLITAGWLLRMYDPADGDRWKRDVPIGVFAGLCL